MERPDWITSLGARVEVNDAAHSCGGLRFMMINNRFAKKAIEKGADGLTQLLRCRGQAVNFPLALIGEIREWFNGPLLSAQFHGSASLPPKRWGLT